MKAPLHEIAEAMDRIPYSTPELVVAEMAQRHPDLETKIERKNGWVVIEFKRGESLVRVMLGHVDEQQG